jgi:ankyrin repeat protein
MMNKTTIFAAIALACICLVVVVYGGSRPSMPKEELDRAGRSPLFYAARDGDVDEIKRLIRAGADVNLKDVNGHTPLHFAAQEQKVEAAKTLLEAGAKLDEKDRHGNTPLMRAVATSRGEGEMIRLLRKWGADPFAKNNYGISPVESARMVANFDIAQHFSDLP